MATHNITWGTMPNGQFLDLSGGVGTPSAYTNMQNCPSNGVTFPNAASQATEVTITGSGPQYNIASSSGGNKIRKSKNNTNILRVNANSTAGYNYCKIFFACEDGLTSTYTTTTQLKITYSNDSVSGINLSVSSSGVTQNGYQVTKTASDTLEVSVVDSNFLDHVMWVGVETVDSSKKVSGNRLNGIVTTGTGPQIGYQAIAYGSSEPFNCFHPDTKVLTSDGFVAVGELKSGQEIITRGEDGDKPTKIDVISMNTLPTSIGYKIGDTVVSGIHALLFPEKEYSFKEMITPVEEWKCTACSRRKVYGCRGCTPFRVPGYFTILARNIQPSFAEKKVLDFVDWHHVVPHDFGERNRAVVLEGGILSEMYRQKTVSDGWKKKE